jgi:hypothetical protein
MSGGARHTPVRWRLFQIAAALSLVIPAASASALTLTRGPYLQRLTERSVTIVWNTDVTAACSVHVRPLGGGPGRVVSGPPARICAIPVDGLFPGARYAYTPRANGAALLPETVFRTDDPAKPFTFLVFGDSGDGSPMQYHLAAEMERSPADLIVHTGDMNYLDGAAETYDAHFFTPYKALLRRLVLWPCLGDNDQVSNGRFPWFDVFYTPANSDGVKEEYYSFDYGNAHFVVLDTSRSSNPGGGMYEFLERDLAATDALWKFIFLHKPIYSSRAPRRLDLVPLIDRYGVDIVFNGEIHNYERTKALRADQIVADGAGAVYITTGGGGKSIGPAMASAITAYTESAYHFTRVAIDGGALHLDMVRVDGRIRDTMTLTKGAPATCGDGRLNHRAEQCDGADDRACPGACDLACACPPQCGDGVLNADAEECDGADDEACAGRCTNECQCAEGPIEIELAPIADTFIDADTPTWDHGAARDLGVDAAPERVIYLKFDLRGLAAPVVSAALTLYATDPTDNGGTVYPVGNSSWVEGDRTGSDSTSAQGRGLKWNDVDTDRNKFLSPHDVSPFLPDFSRPIAIIGPIVEDAPVTVSVTSAFANGPGIYTLAIRTDSPNKGMFGSREDSEGDERPRLRLELASSAACTTAADCSDSVMCTADVCHPISGTCLHGVDHSRCDNGSHCDGVEFCRLDGDCQTGVPVVCDDAVACTIDRCDDGSRACESVPEDAACEDGDVCTSDRCDAATGCRHADSGLCDFPTVELEATADTHVEPGSEATWDHGKATELEVDASPERITFLKFPGSSLPVTRATMSLHATDGAPDGGTVYRVPNAGWVEGEQTGTDPGSAAGPGLKWTDVDTDGDGTLTSADASPYVPDFTMPIAALGPVTAGPLSVDITSVFQNGQGPYSLAIRTLSTDKTMYGSREQVQPARRPRVLLELRCAVDADCNDGFPCTMDSCDALGRCVHLPNDAVCDDGIECTHEYCDSQTRECTYVPRDPLCDNGRYCDGSERCDTTAGCVPGEPIACDDGIPCTADACDETIDGCASAPVDAACDDNDACTSDACDVVAGCHYGDSGLCTRLIMDLAPVADTYIEAGAQATWDHGAAPLLKVDREPFRIVYFKFDLSSQDHAPIEASLRLRCTDPSPNGGTLYLVPDSTWPEGNRVGGGSGSAAGPGLKFVQVDTDGDGVVTVADQSPYVPDFGAPIASLGPVAAGSAVTIDVVAALQGPPGMVTFALVSDSLDGAFYASREALDPALRPNLHVMMPPLPECVVDADCDDGMTCTVDTCDAPRARCVRTPMDAGCDDGIACTVDRCDPEAGGCLHLPDHPACDNGAFCDGVERCDAALGCAPGTPPDCDDDVACTIDACDETQRRCVHGPDDVACDDGNLCTTDLCVPGRGCDYGSNGICELVAADLPAVADTYIEAGPQASWDHGVATELKVDRSPARVVYFKFDLTNLIGPIIRADLVLYCTDLADSGGTLYPVGDSSWREGDRSGTDTSSAQGPGLKWVNVDTNGDGAVTAADQSPYVPGLTRPIAALGPVLGGRAVTIDVTEALRGASGLRTLALVSTSTDGAFYGSREAALTKRPVLRLEMVPMGRCATDAFCDDEIPCTEDRCERGLCRNVPRDDRCDDGVTCTIDVCDQASGGCVPVPDDDACADASVCNGAERCDEEAGCLPGEPPTCDDGIACTLDSCDDAAFGCVHAPQEATCDDGDSCTRDVCAPGVGCQHPSNGLCDPVTTVLGAVADTYIEAGAQATWDHGSATTLKADTDPWRVIYLKFDLSGMRGTLAEALLTLHCTDPSPAGGTIYPVTDSSWIEGNRTGSSKSSAAGPGLKWVQVDTNGDRRLTSADTSPFVPDFSRPIASLGALKAGQTRTVNVTAALQGAPGVYTLAVAHSDTNGPFFGSRQGSAALRPQLRLTTIPPRP